MLFAGLYGVYNTGVLIKLTRSGIHKTTWPYIAIRKDDI